MRASTSLDTSFLADLCAEDKNKLKERPAPGAYHLFRSYQ